MDILGRLELNYAGLIFKDIFERAAAFSGHKLIIYYSPSRIGVQCSSGGLQQWCDSTVSLVTAITHSKWAMISVLEGTQQYMITVLEDGRDTRCRGAPVGAPLLS